MTITHTLRDLYERRNEHFGKLSSMRIYIRSLLEGSSTELPPLFSGLVFGELRSEMTQCCINFRSSQEVLDWFPEKPLVLLERVEKSGKTAGAWLLLANWFQKL